MSANDKQKQSVILIASGDDFISSHYRLILETVFPVMHAGSGTEMMDMLENLEPALLFIDPLLYPESANDHITAVIRKAGDTHVMVIENHDNRVIDQHTLFKAGAHGFCMDDISDTLLNKAVQLVLDGDYWVQTSSPARSARRRVAATLTTHWLKRSPRANYRSHAWFTWAATTRS